MHFLTILILSFSEVIIELNCVPVNSRARHSSSQRELRVNASNINSRRRDIRDGDNLDIVSTVITYESSHLNHESESKTNLKPRDHLLLPELDSTGRPQCLSTPDDTFCESVTNYPNSTIRQEIEFTPEKFSEIFGTKGIEGRYIPKNYIDDDFDLSEERVCGRIPRVIYPKMAKNQENQWIYVVNEVEYTQAVVAEICEKEGKACAYLDRNLPPGMYSRCRQKYSYKRLLALHPTEKKTYSDTFKFPSCCACHVKSNEILGRALKAREKRKN